MMRLGIGPVTLELGGDSVDLLAQLFINSIDLLIEGIDLEIAEINIFLQFCARLPNLTAQDFMPFQHQIKLATNIFQENFQRSFCI